MKNIFSLESPVMIFLGKMADLIILNLLFVFCSAPIITIGASATAMCYVTLKARDGYEGSVPRYFLKSFKENFLQATGIWMLILVLAAVLGINYRMLSTADRLTAQVMRVIVYIVGAVLVLVTLYVFFLQARFQNSIPRTLRNALAVAVGNAPRSILAGLIAAAAVNLSLRSEVTFGYALPVWTIIGFALMTKLNCYILCGNIKGLAPSDKE